MIDRLRAIARMPSPWLFLLLLAVYCLTLGGEFFISDGEVVFQTTVALTDRRELALECNPGLPQIVSGIGGQCFSKYGIGTPLLAVLPYKFGLVLSRRLMPGTHDIAIGHFFVSFMNLVITAGTGLVLYWFARDLYRSRWLGVLLALVYGLTTSAWPYSKFFFSEPLVAFLALLAAYALFRLRAPGWPGLAWAALGGLAIGYAIVTKVASVILLPPLGLYLLWRLLRRPWLREDLAPTPPAPAQPVARPMSDNFIRIGPHLAARQALRRPSRRVADPEAIHRFPVPLRTAARQAATAPAAVSEPSPPPAATPVPLPLTARALLNRVVAPLVAFGLPLALCLILILWHNAVRFGSPFDSGYSDEGFTTPLYVGLYGFLFSSGKSIFLYSPVVLLSLAGFGWLWRRRPAETLLLGSLVLITLLYYSAWWAWYGGWSWGPRFLVPTLPLLVLPIGALLLARVWARWALMPLAILSIGVQLLGALIDFNPYIVEVVAGDPANEAKYIFYPWLSPVLGHLRYLLEGRHLAVATFDLTRLGFGPGVARVFPIVVIASLLLAIAGLTASLRPGGRRQGGGRA